jgi:hypothetical protein
VDGPRARGARSGGAGGTEEAQAAARLEHPNIVEVVDFWSADGGRPCIVMELLRSSTLASELREHAPGLGGADVARLEVRLRQIAQRHRFLGKYGDERHVLACDQHGNLGASRSRRVR